MAQPTNTFDSYDAKGLKEDLEDVIYDVSPEETPFYTACAKVKATNTLHEWQTDTLRSSAVNAHIEGDDTVAEARTATVRLQNYSQIFKNAVVIAGTEDILSKAGRTKEMAYMTMKMAAEQKLDIEKALFASQARVIGSSTAARKLAGAPAWLTTNVNFVSASSGANPNGLGTNTRTDSGAPTAFTQAKFDDVMQDIWASGGKPDTVYLSSFQQNVALGFVGNNNQRSAVQAGDEKVVKSMVVYVTPWGTVEFKPTRENRSRDIFIMQDDMWACGVLRGTKSQALSKTGDNEKRQIVTELTLVCRNEKASGGIFDNTTS